MERFPWHPRLRHAGIATRLVIAAVAALTLVVVAAVGMAATSAPGPNGCPTNKSVKTAPIADLAPPARTRSKRSTCCPDRSTRGRRPSR